MAWVQPPREIEFLRLYSPSHPLCKEPVGIHKNISSQENLAEERETLTTELRCAQNGARFCEKTSQDLFAQVNLSRRAQMGKRLGLLS